MEQILESNMMVKKLYIAEKQIKHNLQMTKKNILNLSF